MTVREYIEKTEAAETLLRQIDPLFCPTHRCGYPVGIFAWPGDDIDSRLSLDPKKLSGYMQGTPLTSEAVYEMASRGKWIDSWRSKGFHAFFSVISSELILDDFLAVALHEGSHFADNIDRQRRGFKSDSSWVSHGLAFIRICCHFAHRARELGHSTAVNFMNFAGPNYGLSDRSYYEKSLAEECSRNVFTPILDVLLDPPSTEFNAVFQRDVRYGTPEDMRRCVRNS